METMSTRIRIPQAKHMVKSRKPSTASHRPERIALLFVLATAVGGMLLGGCRLEMYDQSRVKPLEETTFFADSQTARLPIDGTVPRGGRDVGAPDAMLWDTTGPMIRVATGGADTARSGATSSAAAMSAAISKASIPIPVTRAVLDRGQQRFNIYCSPCHGRTGEGNGMIVQRGFPKPPSYHLERLRTAPDGHFYDVMTNGFGMMYSYASRVKPIDRWAIVAYIRALQLSHDPRPENLADTATGATPAGTR